MFIGLGRVPVEQVPGAIASMDVCLLPYEQSPWTAAIDSLKLYEYLACGKPVVATDVPAAHAAFAEGLVRVGDGPADSRHRSKPRWPTLLPTGGGAEGGCGGEHLGRPGGADRDNPERRAGDAEPATERPGPTGAEMTA